MRVTVTSLIKTGYLINSYIYKMKLTFNSRDQDLTLIKLVDPGLYYALALIGIADNKFFTFIYLSTLLYLAPYLSKGSLDFDE